MWEMQSNKKEKYYGPTEILERESSIFGIFFDSRGYNDCFINGDYEHVANVKDNFLSIILFMVVVYILQ